MDRQVLHQLRIIYCLLILRLTKMYIYFYLLYRRYNHQSVVFDGSLMVFGGVKSNMTRHDDGGGAVSRYLYSLFLYNCTELFYLRSIATPY